MRSIPSLAAAAAATLTGSAALGQTLLFQGTNPSTGHSYYISDVTVAYSTGRTLANDISITLGQPAYLAAINSAEEQQFINSLVGTFHVFWIGLTTESNPGGDSWAWDSGEPVTYTNWLGGAPVLGDPLRNYVSMNWDDSGRWLNLNNDGAPFGFKFALVEVVPSPGAASLLALAGVAALRRRR